MPPGGYAILPPGSRLQYQRLPLLQRDVDLSPGVSYQTTRYHVLLSQSIPSGLNLTACTADGTQSTKRHRWTATDDLVVGATLSEAT